jgi:inorganic pyrophosphatase
MYKDISDLPPHIFNEMKHFFEVYKILEDKSTVIQEMGGAVEAKACIEKCMNLYKEKFDGAEK